MSFKRLTNPFPSLTGRIELRLFLVLYFLSLPFQLLTTGSVLEQGSLGLTVITAIHGGIVAALFWGLLANALVATQVVEDGTFSSLIVSSHFFCFSLTISDYHPSHFTLVLSRSS